MEKDRYTYYLNKINEHQAVYVLKAFDELIAMFEDEKGNSYMPVWGDEESAKVHLAGEWSTYFVEKMGMKEVKNWLRELDEDNILIAAFPDDSMKTIPVHPLEFLKQLPAK